MKDPQERLDRALHNKEGTDPLPDAAHVVTFMLERIIRDTINDATPGYGIAKNAPGTGGNLPVDVTSLVVTGEEAAMEDIPTDDAEFTKVKGAIVNDGPEFVVFDNPNDTLDSGSFASLLTASKIRARLLGSSRYVEAPVRHTTSVVVNHMKGTREILRRFVMIESNST